MGVMINFSSWEWHFLITIIPMWLFHQFVFTTILTWCCEHENKIKHKYLVDKKPRYQLRPHKTAPRLTCDLCEWLAMEPTLLRPNIKPCCEFIRTTSATVFDSQKHSQNLPDQWRVSESVRDHFWDKGDLTETLFDTDGEWPRSLRPNPKIRSQRGRNPGVNGVLYEPFSKWPPLKNDENNKRLIYNYYWRIFGIIIVRSRFREWYKSE